MLKFVTDEVRTARKTHRCDDCGRLIVPGSRYHRAFLKDGHRGYDWRAHLACIDAVKIVVAEAPHYVFEDGWPRVAEFETEDFETVREIDPEVWAAIV